MAEPAAESRSLQDLLLAMPQEHSCQSLMEMVVRRLAAREPVALARVWLLRPGDICATCPRRHECPGQVPCLHLVASAGRSVVDPQLEWNGTEGNYRRFPVGIRKVGHVAARRKALEIGDIKIHDEWLVDPAWAERERIEGFAGQPVLFRGELIGVLAVFLRAKGAPGHMDWLRLIVDHLAGAITSARAFEEIQRLKTQLELENEYLRTEVLEAAAFGGIVGKSAALEAVLRQIELVAPTDSTVLITGESGVGKELVAREIYRRSARSERPMIRVNCASIPRELFESEFFGHVKGAFTGATRDRVGRFALADGGTIFLDEVGEIPPELQSKLLRVLQEGEYERLGDERSRKTDARVIAATNRDLRNAVDERSFREDLYYRLSVFPIEIPSLRRRPEDIPPLAAHFVRTLCRKLNRPEPRLTKALLMRLQAYDWPGNVRELHNVVERALITSPGTQLRVDLPETTDPGAAARSASAEEDLVLTEAEMRRREKENLRRALRQTRGKIYGPEGAAELLGVKPTTLVSRIKKLGLERWSGGVGEHLG
jgi:transcriptional regulator with GAF, ATPase, and Fis domain